MGMKLCDRYNTNSFVEIKRKLRVINNAHQNGFPITYEQLNELTIVGIANRFTNLENWLMAINFCVHAA